jgi:hypothetical protein
MPAYRIQSHTRHKSARVVAGYIREADKWMKSGGAEDHAIACGGWWHDCWVWAF